MTDSILLLVLMGAATSVVARARGRGPILWGVVGALSITIAVPLLLILPAKGERKARKRAAQPEDGQSQEQDETAEQPVLRDGDTQPIPVQ